MKKVTEKPCFRVCRGTQVGFADQGAGAWLLNERTFSFYHWSVVRIRGSEGIIVNQRMLYISLRVNDVIFKVWDTQQTLRKEYPIISAI